MKRTQLEGAILRTLSYAAVFHSGLRVRDLSSWLIGASASKQDTLVALRSLVKSGVVTQRSGWVYLPFATVPCILVRREKESATKLSLLQQHLSWISWIPSIRGIAVTGSVAASNATSDDDIDLMIVTSPGWLWTTRLLVECIVLCMGKLRRRSTTDVRNLWCLNIWLDETALLMRKQSLYVAREVLQATWVMSRGATRETFLSTNAWVQRWYPSVSLPSLPQVRRSTETSLGPLERFCFWLQTTYMRSQRTVEVISRHSAFFHPRNTSGDVLKEYEKIYTTVRK